MSDQYLDVEESFWTITVKKDLLDEQLCKYGEDELRWKFIRDMNSFIYPLLRERYVTLLATKQQVIENNPGKEQ